ncbi:E3 ubiquitin-protein ligase PHF7-like isoform X12 [Pelodiscus sinensis]|uniref:E3 ubiquitin-protein ligase PHF7-like isoform X12 n=1 Tax=Pelodiscus sinensis TaxID=13735 RepID=UPI003F6CA320
MSPRTLVLQEAACGLCRRPDSDPDAYGQKCRRGKLCVHENCLYHASGLRQRGQDEEGFYGFLYPDIRQALKRAAQKACCVCGCRGASVVCQGKKCSRSFHFPCGAERGCISQFFGEFKSFCWKHRPAQRVRRRRRRAETVCVVCLEAMPGRASYSALVCPACKRAWFHRSCIQGLALRAALYHFRCPRCRDVGAFQPEMFRMGIKIPDRDAAWEEEGAFSDQYHRHSRCDASRCLHEGGREQAAEAGLWQLLLCSSCGSQGTHRRCAGLGSAVGTWECEDCVGPASAGPASRQLSAPGSPAPSPATCRARCCASASAGGRRPGPSTLTLRSRLCRPRK